MILLGVLTLLSIAMIVFVATTLQVSELRVVTHYTAFGATHFYRDQWAYLISFGLFALLSAALTTVLALKIMTHQRISLAIAYVWCGIFLIIFAWVVYARIVEFL